MEETATIRLGSENYVFPVITGTENEKAIDIRNLRQKTGYITFDDGYGNTGSCESLITFIDGEKGILRYRGYPIEELAESSTFIECAYVIIYGNLPTRAEMREFSAKVLRQATIHESMRNLFEGFPTNSHPMAILSALLNSLGCYYPDLSTNDRDHDLKVFDEAATLLLSKVRTIAAMSYRMKRGLPFMYPRRDLGYSQNFLHMMFSEPYHDYYPHDDVTKALDLIFLLHADHEQNCSTSTVRMVASGGANLFASVSAGVCALWGPLHGGANMAVIKMLQEIHSSGDDGSKFVEAAKTGKARLMGFGHRVYKNYDPRAKILKVNCERVLKALGLNDPLLNIALHLEDKALHDPYFIERKLYPNVDFYSGIILQAIGLPLDMFTVIFSIGRMPGWIAHWKEIAEMSKGRIHRPRQIYLGPTIRNYVPMRERPGSESLPPEL
jgi:citrate synthase